VLGAADLAGREVVVRELGGPRAGALERLAGAQVQPHAAARGRPLVERLADERVAEREVVDLARVLRRQAGAQRLLDAVEDLAGRPVDHRLDVLEPEVAPEHRRGGQRLDRDGRQPRQPSQDDVLDALRHAWLVGRLGEAAQRLLDEERVAAGLLVHAPGELAVAGRDERGGRAGIEPLQAHLVPDRLTAQPGEQARERRVRPDLHVAVGGEHHQREALALAHDLA
jgi:hypothetical protein